MTRMESKSTKGDIGLRSEGIGDGSFSAMITFFLFA